MRIVTVREIEYMAIRLAKELLSFNEPIPDFSTRYPNILESCLAAPFQRFSGKYLYSSLISKASVLFYLMIKNHPFQNGNKRIAMTTLFVFCPNMHLLTNLKYYVSTRHIYTKSTIIRVPM